MIIALIGYMASGKSHIGQVLANTLSYKYMDLDTYIEDKEGKAISDIFNTHGEIYFRKAEANNLREILDTQDNLILSLGGGTPCYGSNMELLTANDQVVSIYLKASIRTLADRLEHETQKRPLVAHLETRDDLVEFIGKHLFERSGFYNKADITIVTDGKPPDEVMEAIVMALF